MSDSSTSALAPCPPAVQQTILGLAEHDTEERLSDDLEQITRLMRFDFYHYVGSFSKDGHACIRHPLSNLPTTWCQIYAGTGSAQSDPIAQAVRFRVIPVMWKEPRFGASDLDNSYRIAQAHGIGDGIVVPVHSRNGDAAALGFFVRAERDDGEETICAALGDTGLTAMYVHDSMSRIVAKTYQLPRAPLTRRELECLHWIALHKSNSVIGQLLDITEHGVVAHVRKIMWKLDAQNRYQAVARATAYGLI